jgi:hypothetical protein
MVCASATVSFLFPIPGGGAGLFTILILRFYVLAFFMMGHLKQSFRGEFVPNGGAGSPFLFFDLCIV